MTSQDWRALGKYVSVYNNDIFVIDTGKSKETIVILHGHPTLSYDYHSIIPELVKEYRVIIHDHLGFGFSDSPDEMQYSLIDQADIALRLWSFLGLKEVTILAHDYGSYVAKEILARKNNNLIPLKIKKIILCSSSENLESLEISNINSLLNEKQYNKRSFNLRKIGSQKVKSTVTNKIYDFNSSRNQYEEAKKIQITSNFIKDRYIYWHRWTEALRETEIPVKIFWQKTDSSAIKEMAIVLAVDEVNPKIEWIENTGDFSIMETPIRWLHLVFDINNQKSRIAAFF